MGRHHRDDSSSSDTIPTIPSIVPATLIVPPVATSYTLKNNNKRNNNDDTESSTDSRQVEESRPKSKQGKAVEPPRTLSPVFTTKRPCRDVVCFIIFIIFWVFLIASVFIQGIYLDFQRVTLVFRPVDRNARVCGDSLKDRSVKPVNILTNHSGERKNMLYDPVAPRYDLTYGVLADFCQKLMNTNMYDELTGFHCADISAQSNADAEANYGKFKERIQQATSDLRYIYDFSRFQIGFVSDTYTVCVDKAAVELFDSNNVTAEGESAEDKNVYSSVCYPTKAPTSEPYEYICDIEAYLINPKAEYFKAAAGTDAVYNPFLTKEDYNKYAETGMSYFCHELATEINADKRDNSHGMTPPTIATDVEGALKEIELLGISRCQKNYIRDIAGGSLIQTGFNYLVSYFRDFFANFCVELKNEWPWVLGGCLVAIALCYLWLVLLRFVVSCVIYIMIVVIIGGVAAGGIYLTVVGNKTLSELERKPDVSSGQIRQANLWFYGGIVVCCVDVIIILIFVCFARSICTAIAVIQVASNCLRQMMHITLVPLFFVIIVVIHLGWTCVMAASFYSSGVFDGTMRSFSPDGYGWASFLLMVFGIVWGMFWLLALSQFIESAAIAQWFFTEPTKDSKGRLKRRPLKPLGHGFKWAIKYLGTLAFASFFVAFIVWVRFILNFIKKRIQASAPKLANNKMFKCIFCYCNCCLKCLEKILKYINRNSIIYTAITGTGYCRACCEATKALLANLPAVICLNTLGDFFLALGKWFIAIVMGVAVGCIISYGLKSTYYFAPAVMTGLISFVCCSYLLNIAEIAVDTVFFCYLYDQQQAADSGIRYSKYHKELKMLIRRNGSGCAVKKNNRRADNEEGVTDDSDDE